MSIDRSLKIKGALRRHRNVLKRAERIEKLEQEERWDEEEDSVLGLPKVAHRKVRTRKPGKEEAEAVEAAAEGEEAAAPGEQAAAEPAPESEKSKEK